MNGLLDPEGGAFAGKGASVFLGCNDEQTPVGCRSLARFVRHLPRSEKHSGVAIEQWAEAKQDVLGSATVNGARLWSWGLAWQGLDCVWDDTNRIAQLQCAKSPGLDLAPRVQTSGSTQVGEFEEQPGA